MKQDISELAAEGGVGAALSYFLLTTLTKWLHILPPIPDQHYLTMIAAGGVILAGIGRSIRWIYKKYSTSST